MNKAIIFDFDGLLIDTESVWYECFKEVLQEYEVDLPLAEFSKVIGTHDSVLYSYIQDNVKVQVESSHIEEAVQKMFEWKMGQPVLRPGVKDYLESAQKLGLKIGLASSSSLKWVEGYLKQLDIHHYFDVIRTREDVVHVKPDPELYRKAVEGLGVKAPEAVAFEDSLNGLQAARKAGLRCVIVPNAVTADLPFTDYSLRIESMENESLEEVLKKVETSQSVDTIS